MDEVVIYTDGACSNNPGIGGWGAVLMYGEHKKEISGSEELTTNNRMELSAAIHAMKCLKRPCIVNLYTDSSYLCNAFNQNWIWGWLRNGWKTSNKTDVENRDLWQELLGLVRIHKVNWHKVKGHADNEYNNRCDELARSAIIELRKSQKSNGSL